MSTSESVRALRRANPRGKEGFAESVEAAADAVRDRILAASTGTPEPRMRISNPRRRLLGVSAAGVSLAAAAVVAAFLTVGSSGPGPGVEDAIGAVKKAATVTAASAERSGTAIVRITHNGEVWAGKTIRWHEGDVALSDDAPHRLGRAGSELRVVDGTVYAIDPVNGGWVMEGKPENIDPDSGTTPDEHLAAVREDVRGATLRRIAAGMTGLTTRRLDDGSTVYRGTVEAGRIAREAALKGGRPIRVFPFGYVAHDAAADPAAPLDVAITVGTGGVVRKIAVAWGTSASAWTYTVTYSDLGTTPPLVAPANARSLLRERSHAVSPD
jgi:hypothetical protein